MSEWEECLINFSKFFLGAVQRFDIVAYLMHEKYGLASSRERMHAWMHASMQTLDTFIRCNDNLLQGLTFNNGS